MTGRQVPIFPTVVVLAAVATMVALGFWQLRRADWKEGMIARYEQALTMSSEVSWPPDPAQYVAAEFRRTSLTCDSVNAIRGTAGRSASDTLGWSQIASCDTADGTIEVALGWSQRPDPPVWSGGAVQGLIVPAGDGVRLIAMPPVAGLQPLASPDPKDLPNNHLAYAGQWFFFALTALVIYVLALRGRKSRKPEPGNAPSAGQVDKAVPDGQELP